MQLWNPVNNSRLIAFRVLFGMVMAMECIGSIANGEVNRRFIQTHYNFTFIGFDWLNALHGKMMYAYFGVMVLVAILVSIGLFYRVASVILAIMWSAVYLADKSQYNNHYYLFLLLCWLMIFVPANKRFSLDIYLKGEKPANECNAWHINIFIFQIVVVYLFAAIAKMNNDWLHAIPVRTWLYHKTGLPLIGHYLRNPIVPWIIAYGGLLFDLMIVPAMLFSKTRWAAFGIAICFHAFNSYVFDIGMFPLMALVLFVFFFSNNFIERFVPRINCTSNQIAPNVFLLKKIFVCLYIFIQIGLPLRHLFIKGNVTWTEEGHRLSWRMMLRSKSGISHFKIVNHANDSTWYIQPSMVFDSSHLMEIAVLPDVTWQAAQYLKFDYQKKQMNVAVFAINYVRLNHRDPTLFIDTTVDLGIVKWSCFTHNEWILLDDQKKND